MATIGKARAIPTTMTTRSSSRGWGFKIDYAQAIADDDKRIAWALRSIEHGLYSRMRGDRATRFDVVSLINLIWADHDVARRLGYSPQDLADLAAEIDYDIWKDHPEIPDARNPRESDARVGEICRDVDGNWLFKDEVDARLELRRAKASRARHVRNQEKYDRDGRIRRACGATGR